MLSVKDKFQYNAAIGRGTLPVAAVITVLFWVLSFLSQREWINIISLAAAGLNAYLLLELNTRFTLIRTRTTLPAVFFLLFYAVMPFLHVSSPASLLPVLFILMMGSLFRSYESMYASATIFRAFFCLGIASLVLPCVVWVGPLLYLHMVNLRSLNVRTFFAGIIGILLPYWFLCGYYILMGCLPEFYAPPSWAACRIVPDYSALPLSLRVSWMVVVFLFIVYAVFYLRLAQKDKVQTRILLHIFIWMGVWINLVMLVYPVYVDSLLPVLLLFCSMLGGHLFSLNFNRFARAFFFVTLILWVLLCLFNLWMNSFSF